MFCHITQDWRNKLLRTFETIVDLTGNTRTDGAGLRVRTEIDEGTYPTGETATDAEIEALRGDRGIVAALASQEVAMESIQQFPVSIAN